MFKIHSVAGRMFVGILSGIITGTTIIVLCSIFWVFPIMSTLGLGTILIFVMGGFTLGLVGMFDRHPVCGFKLHWWNRGAIAGFVFTLIYVLLAYPQLEIVMRSVSVFGVTLNSPFWILIDGTIIGLITAYLETKIAGEGPNLPLA